MLTREQLDHLCMLTALELSEEEKEKLLPQLSTILAFVGQLNDCVVDDTVTNELFVGESATALDAQSGRTAGFLANIRHQMQHTMPELHTRTSK